MYLGSLPSSSLFNTPFSGKQKRDNLQDSNEYDYDYDRFGDNRASSHHLNKSRKIESANEDKEEKSFFCSH